MQFSDVVGQKILKEKLIQLKKNKRISHSLLFMGAAGYGTLPLALAFAHYLLCENPSDTDSCGQCSSCLKNKHFQHPDIHFSFPTVLSVADRSDLAIKEWRSTLENEVYFDLNQWINIHDDKGRKPIIGTTESQEIIKKLSLKSYEGSYKIMLIWMAEEMNADCSNKLLKIIEEPPENTLFFLICESVDKMLPTILSRAQLVPVPRISLAEMESYLQTKFKLEATQAKSVATLSACNIVEAMKLLGKMEGNERNEELFIQCMRVCYKKDVMEMMRWADELASLGRESQKLFLKYCLHLFQQSILMNYTGEDILQLNESERLFLKNFSRFISGNNIEDFNSSFSDAHYQIERNANPKILFTDLCFKVMRFIHRA